MKPKAISLSPRPQVQTQPAAQPGAQKPPAPVQQNHSNVADSFTAEQQAYQSPIPSIDGKLEQLKKPYEAEAKKDLTGPQACCLRALDNEAKGAKKDIAEIEKKMAGLPEGSQERIQLQRQIKTRANMFDLAAHKIVHRCADQIASQNGPSGLEKFANKLPPGVLRESVLHKRLVVGPNSEHKPGFKPIKIKDMKGFSNTPTAPSVRGAGFEMKF